MRNYIKFYLVETRTGDETDEETGRIIRFGETTFAVQPDGPESATIVPGNPTVAQTVTKIYLGPLNKFWLLQILNNFIAAAGTFSFRELFLSSEAAAVPLVGKSPRGRN